MILSLSLNTALDRVYEIPDFRVGERFRVTNVREMAGGKALNLARVATLLGADVTAVGFLAGHTGAKIEELAQADGLRTAFVRLPGESRQCHTFVHQGQESTEVIEAGPVVADDDLRALENVLRQTINGGDLVCLSGSLPPGVPADAYAKLITLVRSLGARPVLDASGAAFQRGVEAVPYAIKPNRPELEEYLGREIPVDDVPQVAMSFHEKGIAWVLISLGGDGMVAAAGGSAWRVEVPAIQVVTAVGSGDAFVGGWAATLEQWGAAQEYSEEQIVAALKRGSAAAVSNALQVETGTCDVNQVRQLVELIKVTKL